MVLDKEKPIVRGLNLGDSGYIIVRNKKVIFHTPVQQWRFNAPYQCGTNHKLPYNADKFEHKVEGGDLLIFASDGLWDNLDDNQIIKQIHICHGSGEQEHKMKKEGEVNASYPHVDETLEMAKCIAHSAHFFSMQKGYESPFAKGAAKEGKLYMGGKEDDITVMVSKIHLHKPDKHE